MNFFILSIIKAAVVAFVLLTALAYLQWLERKVLAHIQLRVGPRRVGPHGLLQPLADVIKLITKEDMMPSHVNKVFWFMAPFIAVLFALIPIAVIPFGTELSLPAINFGPIHTPAITTAMQLTDLNIGVLFILGISGLGVYGVALAGWSSNNKYSLLGGLRSSAQMISYELALTMSVVGVLLMAGSFNLTKIIEAQGRHPEWGFLGWNIWPQILGFLCFFIAAIAETNRAPFDLPEAESELVAGFHTEYASFKFAMFFIAEYTSMTTISCLCSILFFGGWLSPFPASWTWTHYLPSVILIPFGLWVIWDGIRYETIFGRVILPVVGTAITALGAAFVLYPGVNEFIQGPFWLLSKIFVFLFIYVWMRGTLPRFRYDQLMAFGWKLLLPISIVNVIVTSFVILAKMQWGGK